MSLRTGSFISEIDISNTMYQQLAQNLLHSLKFSDKLNIWQEIAENTIGFILSPQEVTSSIQKKFTELLGSSYYLHINKNGHSWNKQCVSDSSTGLDEDG